LSTSTAAIPKFGRISCKDGFRRFLKYFVLLVLAPLGVIQKALAILPNRFLIKKEEKKIRCRKIMRLLEARVIALVSKI
jgi:hypothetical protein